MPAPKTKKRRIDPPAKKIEDPQSQDAPVTTTEPATNGTMSADKTPNFETLQLHAGYYIDISILELQCTNKIYRQEVDPTTNARAVPIYATTVSVTQLLMSHLANIC